MNKRHTTSDVSPRTLTARIASLLNGGAVSIGDIAALRRMDPQRPPAAFFKIEGLALETVLPGDAAARQDQETRWAAVIAGLACLGALHDTSRRLGVALAEAQYSESRFARLLRADATRLTDEIPALARFLAAKGTRVDWTTAAELMLSAGRPHEEDVRRHVARDYYGVVAREESR
jgi:CRISPR system Cascade subunit CasB